MFIHNRLSPFKISKVTKWNILFLFKLCSIVFITQRNLFSSLIVLIDDIYIRNANNLIYSLE